MVKNLKKRLMAIFVLAVLSVFTTLITYAATPVVDGDATDIAIYAQDYTLKDGGRV